MQVDRSGLAYGPEYEYEWLLTRTAASKGRKRAGLKRSELLNYRQPNNRSIRDGPRSPCRHLFSSLSRPLFLPRAPPRPLTLSPSYSDYSQTFQHRHFSALFALPPIYISLTPSIKGLSLVKPRGETRDRQASTPIHSYPRRSFLLLASPAANQSLTLFTLWQWTNFVLSF
jgi:hypothetical protein